MFRPLALIALASLTLTSGAGAAAKLSSADKAVAAVRAKPSFAAASASLDAQHARIVEETILLTEIPAPPFKEMARAQAYMAMLISAGLSEGVGCVSSRYSPIALDSGR